MDTNKIFIDMAQRAHEFAEMCERMANEAKQKADPEAWREEYRKKQAAGVRFECRCHGDWCKGAMQHTFECNKEDYREVPQDVSASECQKALEHLAKTYSADKGTAQLNPTIPPHAAERALWKAQREAGTNEVWQVLSGNGVADIRVDVEPNWHPDFIYRVKPMKLTAKICRVGKTYPMSYSGQDWQFTGTREEYRAECEKYGYSVVSEIKEVVGKPKTVKYYFALIRNKFGTVDSLAASSMISFNRIAERNSYIIIGDIEEREIEA